MVCGPKKNKKKVGTSRKNAGTSRKNAGTSRKKHTQLENDVLPDPLGVRGSNLVQKKGMNAENGLRPKKTQKKPGTSRKNAGTSRKPEKRRDFPKKHTQLENGVLADPLGVRGSSLDQKKGMNAKNGLRPKKKKKVGTSRKNAGTSRKNTLNWKMTSWPIPWELEAQTLSKKKVSMPKMVCGPKKKKKKVGTSRKNAGTSRKNAGTSRKNTLNGK
jgi:hypothetical protein